ncbi:ATP-binding cassette transporter [Ganoderma sinense ZZ0214-1]|uniref:ATP-binding cassette transporter n=1 Tax=Ganoderma sinense ZZ0214-1 TaxID=1077348 RepID=A0A2G8S741_9APHY|nr:ATP-binding cassette transporter [Ganoderma sinense ZZ0214-1]
MDDPGGSVVRHSPQHSIQHFTRELHQLPNEREEMFSIYDLALSATLSVLLSLFAITTPNDSPQSPNHEDRAYSWLFYGARISILVLVLALTCLPSRWRNQFKVFRNIVLLATWAVYAYRDIWPLATYDLTPIDGAEGNLLWAKIGLLTLAAIVLPLISPRRTDDPDARPEQRASIFSLVTYGWLDSLIWKAQHSRHLPLEDLPPLAEYNSVHKLVEESYASVDPMQTNGRDVAWGLVKYFYRDLTIMGTMVILASASSFLVPLGLKHILAYVENGPDHEAFKPWVWILALLFGSMAVSMCMQFYHYVSTQVVARTQAVLTQLMFDHALKMRSKATTSSSADKAALGKARGGKGDMPAITNLVTTDLTNVTNASTFVLLILLETPIQVVLSVVFLYSILGWSTFVGVAVMIAMFPVPTELSKRTKGLQGAKAKATDRRVTLVIQMLDMIRTIKFLAWELDQAEKLKDARLDELRAVRKVTMMQIWIGAINVCIPLLIMLASYSTFTLGMKRELSASIVFSSIALFEILRSQLGLIFFRVPILTNGKVSLERINRFLRESELLDKYTTKKNDDDHPAENGHALAHRFLESEIGFQPARFTWSIDSTRDDRHFTLNIEEPLTFEENKLNVIYGPTGSGKTSMLMALLGEMHCISHSGERSPVNLPRTGGVAFAPQESWVLAATVRDNILFGAPYDEYRYRTVVAACALEEDIDSFDAGDETLVGERGITLSGGQKARVTLARAVYSRARILLLDDILSAVDIDTVHHIVRHCFQGELLQDRTVILVTHNVGAVMAATDSFIGLGANGTIVKMGPPEDLAVPSLSNTPPNGNSVHLSTKDKPTLNKPVVPQSIKAEEMEEGHVGWKPMTLLFGNMSSYPILFWVILLGSLFLASIVLNAQIWLLGYWASQYSEEPAARVSVALYIGIYVALLVGSLLTDAASRMVHLAGTLEASARIHEKLAGSILGTTLRWLDWTPTSRVVARCTEDIGAIDGQISSFLLKLLELSTSMVVRLVLVMIVAPIFTGAVVVFGAISGLYARAYMKAQLPVKREQSKTRAPLIGHLNTTVASLVSIRAYGVEDSFKNDMHGRIDRWTRTSNTFYNLNRWVIVRADLIGTIFTVSLAIYLTYFTKFNASNIGFSLNMSIAFSSKVFEFVRTLNTFEVAGNSLERIQQYLAIEQEDMSEPDASLEPEAPWPANGDLVVENLSARYSLKEPKVLEGISFSVKSGERIGIVPTDLPQDPPGDVVYSGRPIGQVGRRTLRKNLTIIPQTPELFQGTIRENLDPFGRSSESDLRRALLGAQGLDDVSEALDSDRLELDTQVSSGGKNLSAGQRQIIALARAIVRKSKLLILDEATSSIDHESDIRIQTALRNQLDIGVTVLTVAHRLSTIQDCDKVGKRLSSAI